MSSEKNTIKTWKEFFEIFSKLSFFEKNKGFLNNYISFIDDGEETAVAHMEMSYNELVLSQKLMSTREFADATYLIINMKQNFWKDSYVIVYVGTLKNATEEQKKMLRSKYE